MMQARVTIDGRNIFKEKISVENCKAGFQLVVDDTSLLSDQDVEFLVTFLKNTKAAANKPVVTYEELKEVIINPA